MSQLSRIASCKASFAFLWSDCGCHVAVMKTEVREALEGIFCTHRVLRFAEIKWFVLGVEVSVQAGLWPPPND